MRQSALVFSCVVVLAGCSGGEPVAMSQTQITTIDILRLLLFARVHHGARGNHHRVGQSRSLGPYRHQRRRRMGQRQHRGPPSGGGGTPPPGTPPPGTPPPNPYARSLNAVGTTFSTILSTPGVYGFHCSLHPPATNPNFVGTITVTE